MLVLAISAVSRSTWRPAVGGALTGAVAVCVIALAQRLFPGTFGVDTIRQQFGLNRLSYPLDYWNAVGCWAAMTAVLAIGISAHARHTVTRALCLAAVPVAAATIYLTYSRAGVIGLSAGVLFLVALGPSRWLTLLHVLAGGAASAIAILVIRGEPAIAEGTGGAGAASVVGGFILAGAAGALVTVLSRVGGGDRWRMGRRAARAGLATGVAVVVAVGAIAGPGLASSAWDQFRQHSSGPGLSQDPAARLTNLNGTRDLLWASSLDAFRAHPGEGTGAGTFEFWQERGNRAVGPVRDAHSLYFESLGELGLPGLLLVLAVIASLLVGLVAARGRSTALGHRGFIGAIGAAFVVFAVQAGVDWMWESSAVALLALVLVGAGLASDARATPRVRLPWRLGGGVLCLVLCATLAPSLLATMALRQSQQSFEQRHLTDALREASRAIALEPSAASPRAQRGLVLQSAGDLRGARADLRAAETREPTNWRHPYVLAGIEARAGHSKRALAAFRAARRLNPRGAVFAGLNAPPAKTP